MKILIEESVLRQALEALGVDALQGYRDSITAEISAALDTAEKVEPVAYQFQDRNGKWCDFIDHKHYKNTVADGRWPIRAVFTHPAPAVPKVGADKTAHDWKCVSPGEYDTLYECAKCGARHMEQADRIGSDRPKFGCTHNAEVGTAIGAYIYTMS